MYFLIYSVVIACICIKSYGIRVMINGLPGPMAQATAEACLNRGFELHTCGFTGGSGRVSEVIIQGASKSHKIDLIKGPGLDATDNKVDEVLREAKKAFPDIIAIDYTHPSATLNNLRSYVNHGIDFVMGTTGGDPSTLTTEFSKGNVKAVIAPNMGKQIVAMQAALLAMSTRFPGAFEGYELTVTESHQSTKADTSGTAKAVVASLSSLNGKSFDVENITKIRDRDSQLSFGVPEESLLGHAFHTYTFTSPDETVQFQLKHNVCGRKVYAEGTADAVAFLDLIRARERQGIIPSKSLFNMIDVLEYKY